MTKHEHVYILGIAGHAMRGVALALKARGYTVTGTDANAYPPGTDWLDAHDIQWWREPSPEHLTGVTLVVLGGGQPTDQPELVEAQKRGVKIVSYPEMVGSLIEEARRIVVTGTHGKTTTTSLITWLLESAGRKPDFLIGIQPHNFDTSVRLSGSDIVVLEGDEYRSSALDTTSKFVYYHPDVAIITSIEHDHPDLFPDLDAVKQRFYQLVRELPRDGQLFVCDTSREAIEVAADSSAPIATYGREGEWRAEHVEYRPEGLAYDLVRHGEKQGQVRVPLYGEHNVLNSVAALAVVINEGVSLKTASAGLTTFKGASRRFERVSPDGAAVTVIDDYAHHPTEVKATIAAAQRHYGGRVIAIFRPHTFSRTEALLSEYQEAFEGAAKAYILPIEGAREEQTGQKVSGADLAVRSQVSYLEDREELIKQVMIAVQPGDVVLCMSVNGYNKLAEELADKLSKAKIPTIE